MVRVLEDKGQRAEILFHGRGAPRGNVEMELSAQFYDANNGQIQLTWCPGFKVSYGKLDFK